jgi:hypothetical protein
VRIITARYLDAIALNTATGVTAAALDCPAEAGWGFYHCRGWTAYPRDLADFPP